MARKVLAPANVLDAEIEGIKMEEETDIVEETTDEVIVDLSHEALWRRITKIETKIDNQMEQTRNELIGEFAKVLGRLERPHKHCKLCQWPISLQYEYCAKHNPNRNHLP